MKRLTYSLLAGAALCAPSAVVADDVTPDFKLPSGYGISATVGGGIAGFTDKTMRSSITQDTLGAWDLKVTLGSHSRLAVDVNYTGSTADINGLTGTANATLVGTSVESALRYNILPRYAVNPYVFVGAGWQRYDITGANFKLSDAGMNASDNSVVFPMGVGLQYRDKSGLVLDAHGTFRANADYGLVLKSSSTTDFAPMHTWQASAAVGYEF